MHRFILRSSVAALTFGVGLGASAVLGIFFPDRSGLSKEARLTVITSRGSLAAWSGCDRNMLVSIKPQPGAPVKLLFTTATNDRFDSGKRRVQFTVENLSYKDIRAFRVGFSSSQFSVWQRSDFGPDVRQLASGESTTVTVNTSVDQTLTAWVESVEFADGSSWQFSDR